MTYDSYNIDQLNRLQPAYLAAFGLTEAPFSLQHDDRFLYLSASLNEQFELLKHYTQYGNLLLIISGERGIGKSSLKEHFIKTAQDEWRVCEIQAHTMMDSDLLLRQIATGFDISTLPIDHDALIEILSEQLEHLHQESFEPILIIDDAHELPIDALKSLLHLAEHQPSQQTVLRIILFCEPEIEIMLEDPAIHSLKERVTHNITIPLLSEEETAEYLRHRLAVAGLDGTSPFTPKLIHKIYKASDGLPSLINEFAHQNLLDDREPVVSEELDLDNEPDLASANFSPRNLMLGGVAVAIVITVLLFQDRINTFFEETNVEMVEAEQIEKTDGIIESTLPNQEIQSPLPIEEKTIEFNLNEKYSENKIQSNHDEADDLTNTTNKTVLKLTTVNPSPVPASKQRQIISVKGTGFHKRQQVKISWPGNEKILSVSQVNVTSDTFMNLILNVGTKAETWKITIIDPIDKTQSNTISFDVAALEDEQNNKLDKKTFHKKTPVRKKSSNKTTSAKVKNGLQTQDWIKQQNKNNYTLQLLGTHQKSTLPDYIKKFALKNDTAIFKTKRNNHDWYTLIYGNFTSKSAAQNAVKQLPKGINKPWIRSFSSIHAVLPELTSNKQSKIVSSATNIPATNIPADQEGWLWSQDPSHYTLQLAAGTDRKAIQTFIKRHRLRGKAVYFHRIRDGKDWYILVYGSYSGYSKAKNAIEQLPDPVQKAKPWARSFSAIHAELN